MLIQKQPGESEAAFMKRIQQLASDPKAFESAVLGRGAVPGPGAAGTSTTALRHSAGHHSNSTGESSEGTAAPRRGYQRVEDWEQEQREQAKSLSWEERVQFDGQRHGNRFQQNEILRRHIKTY
jgi:hypothetical protein